jgi:hypothetical protein
MSFEKIGPYRLTAGDSIIASLVIGFRMAGRGARISIAFLSIVLLAAVAIECAFGEFGMAALAALLLLYFFVLAPMFRARKSRGTTLLTFDSEGLVADTDKVRTTYKWATIGSVRKVGPRLFVMVSKQCAIVVPDRATSRENMQALIATLADDERALPPLIDEGAASGDAGVRGEEHIRSIASGEGQA